MNGWCYFLREIRKKSPLPIYGIAALWLLYSYFLPMYKPSHYLILAALSVGVYLLLSKLFPGKVVTVETPSKPVTTGDSAVDALLAEGETAVAEMKRIRASVKDEAIRAKIDELADITGSIFKDVVDDKDDFTQVRRFANYYLPTTIKLLNAYDRMSSQEFKGENITGTIDRIGNILDTTIAAYKKQLDALFANQALDIETDITVLETMLKREGLSGKDF